MKARGSGWGLVTLFVLTACAADHGPTPQPPSVGSWRYLSSNPAISVRYLPAYAWTGREFFEWGGFSATCGHSTSEGKQSVECGDGALLDPVKGIWRPVASSSAPSARDSSYAVWTGKEVFVWGGWSLIDGGLYNPAEDSWRPVSPAPGVLGRRMGTVIWTGKWVIIWGGFHQDLVTGLLTPLGDGVMYDPEASTWSPVAMVGAPSPRSRHTAVWTGTHMIVWGGVEASNYAEGGGAYDPATDTWTPLSVEGSPALRQDHAAIWTGREMIVLGGSAPDGGRYDVSLDRWTPLKIPAPIGFVARSPAALVGNRIIMWGWVSAREGWGAVYDPATDVWEQMAPAPPQLAIRVPDYVTSTGTGLLLWSGASWDDADNYYFDGALFVP